jgi:hypothetical protein
MPIWAFIGIHGPAYAGKKARGVIQDIFDQYCIWGVRSRGIMPKKKRNLRNKVEFDELEEFNARQNEPREQAGVEQPGISVESLGERKVDKESASIVIGSDPDAVMEEMQQHTLDIEVQNDFEERQNIANDADSLEEDLVEYTHQTPKLSGGDVDAAWEYSDQSGEESVGGSVATPDQDVVEELGEALGITYNDDEELDTAEKLGERDLNRWELNPASAMDSGSKNLTVRSEDLHRQEDRDVEIELDRIEDEIDNLLEEDDLEDELVDADLDPLDLSDEDLEDFDEEDLDLFGDDEFEELNDE